MIVARQGFRDVTPLVQPRSVAVIGASARRVSQGNLVIQNLRDWGFPGLVVPVHPKASSIEDLPAVPSPDALPDDIDLAVLAIPAHGVAETLDALERAGVRAAIVFANGFGPENEGALRRLTETSDIVVHGPNCMGLINVTDRVPLYPTRPSERLRPGPVALIAQSGSAAISLMNSSTTGFSRVVTVGSEFQTTSADYLRWLADDDATSAIGVIIERIHDPIAFAEAAEAVHGAGKTLIVLKVGSSPLGRAAARAHTGALVGKRAGYDRYFLECDIATVRDYDELTASLECAAVLRSRMTPGARIAVVGISGGQTSLACDVAEQASVDVAELGDATKRAVQTFLPGATGDNPIDIGATVREEDRQIQEAVGAVLADDGVDGLALIQDAQASLNPRSLRSYEPILSSYGRAGAATAKPVVLISPTSEAVHESVTDRLGAQGVPVLRGLREGFSAVFNLSRGTAGRAGSWAAARRTASPAPRPEATSIREGPLSLTSCNRLLDAHAIPRVESIVVHSEEEALHRSGEIGFPMVVKIVSEEMAHRSDVGGVVLGVDGKDALAAAMASMRSRIGRSGGEAFELQKQLRGRIEAMVGFAQTPPFGALMTVGTGGTMVELADDHALGLAPVSVEDAEAMIRDTRLGRLLDGYRNLVPKTDVRPLARLVSNLSELAAGLGEAIAAADLNPVLVEKGSGAVHVVDALMIGSAT